MDQKTDRQQAIVTAEMRRRRRERIIIVATILGIALLTFIETSLFSKETLVPDFRDVAIFGLININIILVLLLIFLIVRNIVKLVYERRRGILGSKLRTKLVAAFVTLSLVPTFILFLVATNFLSYSIDNWFNIRVGGALNLSLEVAQNYYQQTSENVKYYADQLSADITKNRLYEKDRLEYLRSLVEQRQRIFKLGLIEVYFNEEAEKSSSRTRAIPISPSWASPPSSARTSGRASILRRCSPWASAISSGGGARLRDARLDGHHRVRRGQLLRAQGARRQDDDDFQDQ